MKVTKQARRLCLGIQNMFLVEGLKERPHAATRPHLQANAKCQNQMKKKKRGRNREKDTVVERK